MRSMQISCLLLVVSCTLHAQYAMPVKDSLQSNVLGEMRGIEITLPSDYSSHDTTRYDVWYVVDGEWNAHTFTNISGYLQAVGFMPPVIIVSIPNRYVNGYNYRDRDLTPTITVDLPNSGGAGNFLRFLERELMPYVQHKYRSSSQNGLFGASFGGLFTMYALLERPSLFRFYVLADPAFRYDNRYISRLTAERLKEIPFSSTALHIGGRAGLSVEYMGRGVMDSILKAVQPRGLHWRSELYDNETHNSVTFKSNYDGLKYAYQGYSSRNISTYPTGGLILKDRPFRVYLYTDNADIRYTRNGNKPDDTAARVDEFLLVSDPSELKIRSFSPSGLFDHDIPVAIRAGNYLSAKKPAHQKGGPRLDTSSRISPKGILEGYVHIPVDGYYILQLTPSAKTTLTF